jgi:hypothetical protein
MAFNIFTIQRVSCFGQYDRIDHLVPRKLRGKKCPVFWQFLVDELHPPAVFKCSDPLFAWHFRASSAEISVCREYTSFNARNRGPGMRSPALPDMSGIGDYAANCDGFQNCTLTRLGLSAFCKNEKERTHAQTDILCSLSYMWCRCREALCAAFRCSAFNTSRRPEACRCRVHRAEMNSRPVIDFDKSACTSN